MNRLIEADEDWSAIRAIVHQKASDDVDASLAELEETKRTWIKLGLETSSRVAQRSMGELEKRIQSALELANASRDDKSWSKYRADHPDGRSENDRRVIRWALNEHRRGQK